MMYLYRVNVICLEDIGWYHAVTWQLSNKDYPGYVIEGGGFRFTEHGAFLSRKGYSIEEVLQSENFSDELKEHILYNLNTFLLLEKK